MASVALFEAKLQIGSLLTEGRGARKFAGVPAILIFCVSNGRQQHSTRTSLSCTIISTLSLTPRLCGYRPVVFVIAAGAEGPGVCPISAVRDHSAGCHNS